MGTSFFKDAIDPIGAMAGKNSWLAKEASYDPVNQAIGKYVAPNGYAAGQAYSQRNTVAPTATPAFAGQAPTLQDAQNGYVQAAQRAAAAQPAAPRPNLNQQQQMQPQQSSWGNGTYGGVQY